jgi:arsenite methyltransferase
VVKFWKRRIEILPTGDAAFDGVSRQGKVVRRAGAVQRPRPSAVADIVTEKQLTDAIVAKAELWAACIGGAAQEDTYRALIEAVGMMVREVRRNNDTFISDQARSATTRYGVKSVSLLAIKT